MFKNIVTVLVLSGMLFAFGCGSPTTPNDNSDLESFFAGVSPEMTGVVGNYTFTANDGSIETGTLIAAEDGSISMVSERGASVYQNFWFDIDVEYLNPRGYTGLGLPYYYFGDTFTYKIKIDYKRGMPLDAFPILYAKLTAEQRYFPGMGLLPGDSVEVWNPFSIPAYGYVEQLDTFKIVAGTHAGNDCTIVKIDLQFLYGMIEFEMAAGVAGLWDP